jgi:hypothetical protein
MTLMEGLLLANSTGVLGLGVGVLKWAFSLDRRVTRIEAIQSTMGR